MKGFIKFQGQSVRLVHLMYYHWNTYVLFAINNSVKSFFKNEIERFLYLLYTLLNKNKHNLRPNFAYSDSL